MSYKLYKSAWIQTDPPHKSMFESKHELKTQLKKGGVLVRNLYNFDSDTDFKSFWFIIKDKFGGMDELSSKVRNQVRRSLKSYLFKKVDLDEILRIGLPIYNAALQNYKVKAEALTEDEFVDQFEKNRFEKNIDYWVVYEINTNDAVALAINSLFDDYCEYNTLKATPSSLGNSTYPYYGLIYEMNKYYLEDLSLKYVSDGARSISEHSNIQGFLESKFNFRKAYCEMQIVYNWWMNIIINICYPIRKFIPVRNLKYLLRQEAMSRNEYK